MGCVAPSVAQEVAARVHVELSRLLGVAHDLEEALHAHLHGGRRRLEGRGGRGDQQRHLTRRLRDEHKLEEIFRQRDRGAKAKKTRPDRRLRTAVSSAGRAESLVSQRRIIITVHRTFVSGCEGPSISELRNVLVV